MDGVFKLGNYFMLKPKGVSPVKIILTEIDDGHKFTDCTNFFGAKMYDTHALEDTPDGLKLINTLVVTGPLKWLWIKLVADRGKLALKFKIGDRVGIGWINYACGWCPACISENENLCSDFRATGRDVHGDDRSSGIIQTVDQPRIRFRQRAVQAGAENGVDDQVE